MSKEEIITELYNWFFGIKKEECASEERLVDFLNRNEVISHDDIIAAANFLWTHPTYKGQDNFAVSSVIFRYYTDKFVYRKGE